MKEANHNTHFNQFARYAGLSVLGTLGVSCYILADTFFVANGLGTKGLAALNIAIPVYNFIWGIAIMLGIGGATRYTIARSRGENELGDRIFSTTLAVSMAVSAVFALLGIFGAEMVARLLGADEEILEMTTDYLRVVLTFAPAFSMNQIMTCFVRNDGAPNLAMQGTLIGSLANIILDYVFIFPMKMGILGAALATVCSPIISLGIMWRHKARGKNNFHLRKDMSDFVNLGKTAALGFPSLVTEMSSGVVIIAFNYIILGLAGNVGVAAYGVIANISLVVIAIYNGIDQGVQPLMSDSYGRGLMTDARKYLQYALVTAATVSVVIYAVIYLGAEPIVAAFNSEKDSALQVIAVSGLKIYFAGILLAGCNIVLQIFFTSVERPLPAQVISLLRGLLLIIPAAFLLAEAFEITGVWLAFPVTETVVAIIGCLIYTMDKRRSVK